MYSNKFDGMNKNIIRTAVDEIPKNSAIPPQTPEITRSEDDFLKRFNIVNPLCYFLFHTINLSVIHLNDNYYAF